MKINNLTKKFGEKIIFDNFSLDIPDGKITFIMGESGSGKTTLLRLISGLDKEFNGEIIKNTDKISCVFQEPRLFPALNASDNIEIVNKGGNLDITDVLKLVELENDATLFPAELSGGMKMRLSIARAVYYNGDIFIMDEPFAALDEELKDRILPGIFESLKGKTVLIVSHSIEDAEKYADNIIKIK